MKKGITVIILLFLSIGAAFAQDENKEVHTSTRDLLGPRNSIGLTYGFIPFDAFFSFSGILNDKTGCISLDYSYRVNEKISVILNFAYSAKNLDKINSSIDAEPQTRWQPDPNPPRYPGYAYIVSAIPLVKYSWIKNELVDLYSAAGVGIRYLGNQEEAGFKVPVHIIPIGITIGKKIYFKGEYGMGILGLARFGVGIKF